MNKAFAGMVVGLALGAVSAVSALDMSAGVGGYYAGNFGGGVKSEISGNMYGIVPFSLTADFEMPSSGVGFYGFVDVNYAELSVGLLFGGGKWKGTVGGSAAGQQVADEETEVGDMKQTNLELGLLLKYPIDLSGLKVFPAVGINYSLCLGATLEGEKADDPGDLSRLWINFGVGADYNLSENLFIRPVILYGIGMESKFEKDYGELIGAMMGSELGGSGLSPDTKTKMSHGLTVKLALGFNL